MTDSETTNIVVTFKFKKETKGALRFQEVDDKGEVIEQAWAKIGSLYLRKSAFERGAKFPRDLKVTVVCNGAIDGPTIA
jgi:hypothetical protein